ncbi:MAG: Uma2 family endonuclease [Caldilineaceae bacterium]
MSAELISTRQSITNGQRLHDIVELEALLSEDGKYVTEEEYWADYYLGADSNYEWNNGRLEAKPISDYAQFRLYLWFLGILNDFLHVNPIGRMIGLEMGFRMELPHKVAIRKPDLTVVLDTNPVPLRDKDRSYDGIFDLCIESISDSKPSQVTRDVQVKFQEYAAGGVPEYFILDERQKETAFYQLSAQGIYVPIEPQNRVIRSQILPGFQFRFADLYRLPEPPELVDDPVYAGFASPFVRAERKQAERERNRAEQERQRAEQEHNRAEQERDRAERYAALLKSVGIDVETLD